MSESKAGVILAADIGTSFIKCCLYDRNGAIVGHSRNTIDLSYPCVGAVEIDPENFWTKFKFTITSAFENASITADDVKAMGICTQRNTFITWHKDTGETFHNFITWKDLRATELCESWNHSWSFKALNFSSNILHSVTNSKRYLAGSIFRLKSHMATPRLLWAISYFPKLKEAVKQRKAYFGCIETWLLWKLTEGRVFSTEMSLASSTGMFDPFINEWGESILKLINVPMHVLPPVKDTGYIYGFCDRNIFGAEFPITAMAGDQQAGMFGCCCFEPGYVKLTMGTGLFADMNTGRKPHTSIHGIYPLIGWKINEELVYLAESSANDAGSVLDWARSIGLFDRVEDTSAVAESVSSSGGVYFVPAFTGLQAPFNNDRACAMFVGLKSDTSKEQLVLSLLESLAFSVYQIYSVMLSETNYSPTNIRCVGGVSKNDFVCQLIADLANISLTRMENEEVATLGIAFLAGLAIGYWTDKSDLIKMVKIGRTFFPRSEERRLQIMDEFKQWRRAVARSTDWYEK